jgi:Acetyltransferase (GNAT) domain
MTSTTATPSPPSAKTHAPPPAPALCLFNDGRFHELNGLPAEQVHRVEHHDDGRLVGSCTGVLLDGTWISGHRAPLGGADFVRLDETPARVHGLWERVVDAARGAGAHEIVVRARPAAHGTAHALSVWALLHLGFAVQHTFLNHHIDISAFTSTDDYLAALNPKARNMIRRVADLDLETGEAATDEEWAAGHRILATNKERRGRQMSLPLAYLLEARRRFPEVVRMTTLASSGRTCAAAITYRLTPEVDLVVNWGDADHDLARSPMNLLALRLVERSIAERVRVLDLGISTDHSATPNYGLAFFKSSVLGQPDHRLDLRLGLGLGIAETDRDHV